MTTTNTTVVAKLGVAFVAIAMLLTMVTPTKAATIEELQALIAQLTAQIATLTGSTSSSAAYTFTRSLTVGAQGADVTALQNYLISRGHSIPAGATGYFGAQTAAAVAAWQAANGVAPAVGYFGPLSQAKYNMMMASVTTTTTTTTGGLTGGAAELTVTNESSDLETEVAAGTTEKVEGFRLQATGGDVRVTNLALKAVVTTGNTGSNRLSRYADTFSVYMNGQRVATLDADDMTRDTAGVYTGNVALSDSVIRVGEANRAIFYIAMTAPSNIDSDDADSSTGGKLTVGVTTIRFSDATGAILTKTGATISDAGVVGGDSNLSTTQNAVTVSKTSTDEKLRIALASDSPKAGVVMIDETATTEVDLLKFTLKAEGTDMTFDRLTATITNSVTTAATDYYLYRGSTKIADLATSTVSSGSVLTFNTYSTQNLSMNDTNTYRIVAKVKRGDTAGVNDSTLSATLGTVTAENKAGNNVSSTSGSATGETLTLTYQGVKASNFTWSSVATTDTSGVTTKQTFTISFNLSAFGETMYIAKGVASTTANTTNGARITTNGKTTLTHSALTSSANTVNGLFEIPDGTSRTFTATVEMASSTGTDIAGFYKLILAGIGFASTSVGAGIDGTHVPAPVQDFETAERKVD